MKISRFLRTNHTSRPIFKGERDQPPRTLMDRLVSQNSRPLVDYAKAREKPESQDAVRKHNRDITLSLTAAGFAAGGWLFPILNTISVALLFPYIVMYYRAACRDIVQERRPTLYLIDSVTLTGAMIGRFYFIGAFGCVLASISRKLLAKTEDNSRKKLIHIFGEQPNTVWRLIDGIEIETPMTSLQKNDIVVVAAGQAVPVDGMIVSGAASIDQHRLTGEAQPAEKGMGESVLASTVVLSGQIHIQVEETGANTQVARIGTILNQTADFKLDMQLRGEALANQSVIPTLAIGGFALPILGLSSALATLYCPIGWFMRLSSPISLLNYLYILSHNDVLVKDARSLELLTKVDTFVFDKTGTLTAEQPEVRRIYTCTSISENELLQLAATAEWKQSHPIARAILSEAEARKLPIHPVEDVRYEVGYGIQVKLQERVIRIGSKRFMELEGIDLAPEMQTIHARCTQEGHSLIMVSINDHLAGAIELHVTIRPEVNAVLHALKKKQKTLCIISGDHEQPTQRLADELGIDLYFANALPHQKAALIDELVAQGRSVCFIGDGINDSIALRKASVSISIAGAAAVATDIADIVLMDGTLKRLPDLLEIAASMEANMKNNFTLAIAPGIICISGAFLFHLGLAWGVTTFMTGLIASVGNSMIPRFRFHQQAYSAQSFQALP